MSKRLAFLEQTTRAGKADAFAWYALALEYRTLERHDEALATFEQLRTEHPGYVPAYLMRAQLLGQLGRRDEARAACDEGIAKARAAGDAHAQSELEDLRASFV